MKKFYSLLLTIPMLAFGQNVIQNGGMENWENGNLQNWSSEEGTTISQESTLVSEGDYAASFHVTTGEQGTTDFRQSIQVEAGKVYTVTVDVYQKDDGARARIYADGYDGYSDPTLTNQWQTLTYEYTATENKDAEFGLRFYDTDTFNSENGSFIIIDNYMVTAEGEAQAPTVQEVATIAELRNATTGETYTLTGEAVITMLQDYRSKKWIQDNTGAIEIDDPNGIITTQFQMYDAITGVTGKLGEYNGIMQFTPTENVATAVSSDNMVEPQVVSIEELNANFEMYESELIKIENLDAQTTGVWENGTNYTFVDSNNNELTVRTNFYDVDYIGSEIPTSTVHLVGIANQFNGVAQLFPRNSEDIIVALSVADIHKDAKTIKVIADSNTLQIFGTKAKSVTVYNTNGQIVANSTNISALGKGYYIAVITDAEGNQNSVKFLK